MELIPANIRPYRDRMLVQHVANDMRTDGGIILPDVANRTHCKGTVIAIGLEVDDYWKGSTVLMPNYSSPDFIHDGERYTFVREKDILALVLPDAEVYALPLA